MAWKSLGCPCREETPLGSLWRRKEAPPHFSPQHEFRSAGRKIFGIGKLREQIYGEGKRRRFNRFQFLSHYNTEYKTSSLYMVRVKYFLLLPHHMITATNIHIYEPFKWIHVVSNLFFLFPQKCGDVKQVLFWRSAQNRNEEQSWPAATAPVPSPASGKWGYFHVAQHWTPKNVSWTYFQHCWEVDGIRFCA